MTVSLLPISLQGDPEPQKYTEAPDFFAAMIHAVDLDFILSKTLKEVHTNPMKMIKNL